MVPALLLRWDIAPTSADLWVPPLPISPVWGRRRFPPSPASEYAHQRHSYCPPLRSLRLESVEIPSRNCRGKQSRRACTLTGHQRTVPSPYCARRRCNSSKSRLSSEIAKLSTTRPSSAKVRELTHTLYSQVVSDASVPSSRNSRSR